MYAADQASRTKVRFIGRRCSFCYRLIIFIYILLLSVMLMQMPLHMMLALTPILLICLFRLKPLMHMPLPPMMQTPLQRYGMLVAILLVPMM